jgi:hypothetical protein
LGESEANANLVAAAPEMLEVLKAVEWAGMTDAEDGGYEYACPFCDAEVGRREGHYDNCKLAAAIAKATK